VSSLFTLAPLCFSGCKNRNRISRFTPQLGLGSEITQQILSIHYTTILLHDGDSNKNMPYIFLYIYIKELEIDTVQPWRVWKRPSVLTNCCYPKILTSNTINLSACKTTAAESVYLLKKIYNQPTNEQIYFTKVGETPISGKKPSEKLYIEWTSRFEIKQNVKYKTELQTVEEVALPRSISANYNESMNT